MATIIALYGSNGSVRRCDARCHEAEGPDCHCICGGAYHGVGGKIAMEDRAHLSDEEIKETCIGQGGRDVLRVKRPEQQLEMFV